MEKSITPTALALQAHFDFNSRSKIPRFQRSQSLRLKGEKMHESRTNCGGSDDSNLSRISLTLANLRAYDPEGHKPVDNGNLMKSPRSSSSTLTRKTSSTEMPLQNTRRSILKQNNSAHCHKLNSPSEYGSLPSTPVPSPDAEDAESVKSFRSFCSAMSLDTYTNQVTQPRRKKYVVHCPAHHHEEEEYLTPTQRKDRLIRHLKAMLLKAKRELDAKDAQILQLTQEVIDLRVLKSDAEKSAPEKEASASKNSSNALDFSSLNSVFHSTKDSGHFEQSDGQSATLSYGSGPLISTSCKDEATNTSIGDEVDSYEFLSFRGHGSNEKKPIVRTGVDAIFDEFQKKEFEEMKRHHANEYQELKEKYNDRIENLLQKLSEANTRYFDLRPKYDRAQERVRQLEKQLQSLERELSDQDKLHHQMYLKMYKKGQEAARFEHADEVMEFAHQAPTRVSVPELLQKLQMTESELERIKVLYRREIYKHSDSIERDSEITLKFLKDAIYHFLTNKDSRDHLRAIESIMGYDELERSNIERNVFTRNKLI